MRYTVKKHFNYPKAVELWIYDQCKYNEGSKIKFKITYDIFAYEIKSISKSDILKETDGSCVDPYNDYLILTMKNGETSTFRNSYCDLFIL